MLTAQECLDYCDLTDEVVRVIAEHEHIPDVVAAELGRTLLTTNSGIAVIERFVREDIDHAVARGRTNRALELKLVLDHFAAATAR